MACIIKKPSLNSKGVITFTTQERDKVIFQDQEVYNLIGQMKKDWIVGLHHNWHDYHFRYNPIFDFSMAGEGDLGDPNTPLVPMDACNFIPQPFFNDKETKKVWDVLYVTRAVTFKRLPLFLKTIRKLYDEGHKLRVLLICCIPPYDIDPADIVADYQSMFNLEERKTFTLIPLKHDYPFTFDPVVLSHFYHSSKVFVHFAPDERRCRVVANAVASKLKIVCREDCASIIPKQFRGEPLYYRVNSDEEYDKAILKAVSDFDNNHVDLSKQSYEFSTDHTSKQLKGYLEKFLNITAEDMRDQDFNFNNLDIRMGRHHQVSIGPNKIDCNISNLISFLSTEQFLNEFNSGIQDVERHMFERFLK